MNEVGKQVQECIEIIDGVLVDWGKFKSRCKKKSGNGYIELFKLLHYNNHKLLSDYKTSNTKVLIDFNCGHEPHWIRPGSYKQGRKCPKCKFKNRSTQVKEDLFNIIKKNNHKLLSEYINSTTKVLVDFNCGHEPHWTTPSNYKRGKGCPKCSLSLDRAREEFMKMLHNNNHKLLSEYINTDTKVLVDFNCGHEPHWTTPHSYKSNNGRNSCPKCSCNTRGRHSLYSSKRDFKQMTHNNNHKLLSEYINNITKVKIDFNCGHEPHWITPHSYKSNNGRNSCPKCSDRYRQAKIDLFNIIKKNGHKLLSEYINSVTKVLVDFNCGHEPHWITPNAYKKGQGCPRCKHKGEGALHQLLLDMEYEVHTQKTYEDLKDKRCLPYDFYLPEYNILIELDGDHHRRAVTYKTIDMTDIEKDMATLDAEIKFYDRKHKDRLKDDYAKNNNIPLLRIEYFKGKIELDNWKKLILDKIEEIESSKIA